MSSVHVRTRSLSTGRAATATSREGVNPFERAPATPMHAEMIETGREAMLRQLEELVGCQVKFVQTVMRGNEPMDQFSVRSADIAHCDQIALFAKLQAIAGTARMSEGIVLVYVRQSRYDRRALGIDATRCQSVGLCLLLSATVLLTVFALGHLFVSGSTLWSWYNEIGGGYNKL